MIQRGCGGRHPKAALAKALIAVPIGKDKVDTEKSYISAKDLTEVMTKE